MQRDITKRIPLTMLRLQKKRDKIFMFYSVRYSDLPNLFRTFIFLYISILWRDKKKRGDFRVKTHGVFDEKSVYFFENVRSFQHKLTEFFPHFLTSFLILAHKGLRKARRVERIERRFGSDKRFLL